MYHIFIYYDDDGMYGPLEMTAHKSKKEAISKAKKLHSYITEDYSSIEVHKHSGNSDCPFDGSGGQYVIPKTGKAWNNLI